MRVSPIRSLLEKRGASFAERAGVEVVETFTTPQEEYDAVRNAVGLCDFSFMNIQRVPEDGLDTLEAYAAGSVANIRFGRVLHTMAVDEEGHLEADLYIANDDEYLVMLAESIVADERTDEILESLGGKDAGVECQNGSTAVFSLDGYKAWAVASDLLGPDVLGLPYLSIENYELDDVEIKLIRGGKTAEFGYLFLVPAKDAEAIWEKIEEAGKPHGLALVGCHAHSMLRLDGRFFNVFEEGAKAKKPLELGLQWMIDMDGDDFRGKEALMSAREAGLTQKIIGVVPEEAEASLENGDEIVHQGETVAKVITSCYSSTLGKRIGLALFELPFAYAGITLETADGRKVLTISMPPFTPKSLSVKLDEM